MSEKAIWEYLKTIDAGGGDASLVSYNDLTDKPSIEGEILIGDKGYEELGLISITNSEIEALSI